MKYLLAALHPAGPLLAALAIGSAAQAQTLPPEKPPAAFTVEFTWEKQEAGATEKGRRRITVEGDNVRDEAMAPRKGETVDPRTYIIDRKKGTAIEFDPADPDKRFKTGPIEGKTAPMAEGYEPLQKSAGKPIPVGGGQVAGNKCTALAWGAENIGRPTGDRQILCVTDDGIVASIERRVGPASTKFSASKISRDKPEPGLFAPPPGFMPAQ